MASTDPGRVTRLLGALRQGDARAADELYGCVYDELHQIAERIFRGQPRGHTLQPTALVNEAYVKLARSGAGEGAAQDRAHLLNLAARAMRQILVNHARDKGAAKRGGDARRVTLTPEGFAAAGGSELDLLDLDDALGELAALDERQARIVELHVFGGLTNPEVAEALGVSLRTVELDWKMARTFLAQRLQADEPD